MDILLLKTYMKIKRNMIDYELLWENITDYSLTASD